MKVFCFTALALLIVQPAFATKKRVPASEIPASLSCAGTEPFWGASIEGKKIKISSPENEKGKSYRVGDAIQAAGFSTGSVFGYQSKDRKISVVVTSADMAGGKCTDGMSDQEFPYHVSIINADAKSTYMLSGCCK